MEFHPVPDDISALSEVAGDEELVLEEETLDSDNGYSERWIPKIEDVDEDEVVAAEMRGENILRRRSRRRRGRQRRAGGDQRPRRVARSVSYCGISAAPGRASRLRSPLPRPRTPRRAAPRHAGASQQQPQSTAHHRPAEGRAGGPDPDCEGAHRQEGRSHHQPHRAARPFPGVHADGEPRRRVAEDCLGRRAAAPEAHRDQRARERPGRIHRAHRGGATSRKKTFAPTSAFSSTCGPRSRTAPRTASRRR